MKSFLILRNTKMSSKVLNATQTVHFYPYVDVLRSKLCRISEISEFIFIQMLKCYKSVDKKATLCCFK